MMSDCFLFPGPIQLSPCISLTRIQCQNLDESAVFVHAMTSTQIKQSNQSFQYKITCINGESVKIECPESKQEHIIHNVSIVNIFRGVLMQLSTLHNSLNQELVI